ncbi:MAG: pyridoxal 5'-phosphate synthase [Planctomycetota bacterium]
MPTRYLDAIASDPFAEGGTLPDTLPDSPWGIFKEWWQLAHTGNNGEPITPNPNAMNIATINDRGTPSSRIVLCKSFDADAGRIVFYTNYDGSKGSQLAARPAAAACFHWDGLDRQVRIEGPILQSPPEESDAYFNSRHILKRLGAWASHQSRPVADREKLLEQYAAVLERFNIPLSVIEGDDPGEGLDIPRPPHWGGFRLWAERMELWIGGKGRFHDRAVWTRKLVPHPEHAAGSDTPFDLGPWSSTRLQP